MSDKPIIFLDSNVLIYAFSGEGEKGLLARQFIKRPFYISTQSLNEVSNVAIRKLKASQSDLEYYLDTLLEVAELNLITFDTIRQAIKIKYRYQYQYFDSLMLASALEAGCEVIYSEDMSNGQIIDGQLRIVNPFV